MIAELALLGMTLTVATASFSLTWIEGRKRLIQTSIDRAYTINMASRGQCVAEIAIELGRPAHQVRDWLAAEGIYPPKFHFTPATYGRRPHGGDDA